MVFKQGVRFFDELTSFQKGGMLFGKRAYAFWEKGVCFLGKGRMLLENYRQLLQIVGSLVHPFLFCLLSIIGICIRGCDTTVVSLRYDHQGVCKSTPWYFSYRI